MIKHSVTYLLFQKDFSEQGLDRYFIYADGSLSEVDSEIVINLNNIIITHDYWLISSSLFNKHNKLPENVLDITVLSRFLLGKKALRGDIQPWDISQTIRPLYENPHDFDRYVSMYYRKQSPDVSTYQLFADALKNYTEGLIKHVEKEGESDRVFNIELLPVKMGCRLPTAGIPGS